MTRPPAMRSMLAAGLLLSAGPLALAATPPMAPGGHSPDAAALAKPPHGDVRPFDTAKLSLTQAIADAQKEMRGKTLDARFEVWQGRPAYLIRTYAASQVWESRIDANTGQPIGQPAAVSRSELGPQVQRNVTALDNAQTTLEQAIADAEQQQGGRAIMAAVKSARGGAATYDIDLVKNGRLHTAMVDASTGQMR